MSELGSDQQEVFSTPSPQSPPSNELTAVPTLAPSAIDVDPFARAAAHMQMFEKLRDVAIRMTRPSDWHLFGDRVWPQRGAAEKIMRGLGLDLYVHRENGCPYSKRMASDEKGGYYIITVSGRIVGQWGSLEAMGFCTSRDQFFASDGTDDNGEKRYKPLSMVNEEHLIQAAYTNFVANAVMRYTGISMTTKEDLEKHYGTGKVSQHTYRDNKPKQTKEQTADDSALAKRAWEILLIVCEGAEHVAREKLKELSGFTGQDGKTVPGFTDIGKLRARRLQVTASIIDKKWDAWLKQKPEDERGFFVQLLEQKLKGGTDGDGNEGAPANS